MPKRRSDSGWRAEVLARYGAACVACGDTAHVQADHLKPKSQGGYSDPRNGIPLCGEFSRVTPGGCHPAKTAARLQIDPLWLLPDTIAWLAYENWVWWDDDGLPAGPGYKHFAPMPGAKRERVEA